MVMIIGGFAEFERELIRARTSVDIRRACVHQQTAIRNTMPERCRSGFLPTK
jgi:DNA invertase Pin-like site-specific DNA recombinase